MKHIRKQHWLERAIETYNYHVRMVKHDCKWTVEDTASSLSRSTGSIAEDMMIASWHRTHADEIKKCDRAYQALQFIRSKKRKLKLELIDDA